MAKRAYIGVNPLKPIYGLGLGSISLNSDNMDEYFTATIDNSYSFAWDSSGKYVSQNKNEGGMYAGMTLTALKAIDISFDYGVSSEEGDKFTVTVNGTTIANAISGEKTGSYSGTIPTGNTITLLYTKTNYTNGGEDIAWLENVQLHNVETEVIVGYETLPAVAHKIKKIYLGVNRAARKVRKGYIGVGGVARPCFGSGLEYYGAITPLSVARSDSAASVVGGLAMVVGGRVDSDNNVTSVIDCYDENLTHSTPVEYSSALYGIGSASLGDMSVFAGGHNKGSSCVNTVNAYDINLTRTVASTGLNNARYSVCGGSIGNHAVFMGGSNSSSTRYTDVHFYDRSLTRTKRTTSQFSDAYSSTMCATNITGYLIVNVGAQLFSINEELTKKTIGNASATRHYGEYATSVDDYAVFANGVTASNSDSNIVDTVDANLTLVKGATTISTGRANNALATSLKGFALFTGGDVCTDVLDNSLTNTIMPPISTAHGNGGCSETIGDYALFFGGYVDSARTNMVDAYVCL